MTPEQFDARLVDVTNDLVALARALRDMNSALRLLMREHEA